VWEPLRRHTKTVFREIDKHALVVPDIVRLLMRQKLHFYLIIVVVLVMSVVSRHQDLPA
jgi:hypothetical protein